jgi:hypothetical protein
MRREDNKERSNVQQESLFDMTMFDCGFQDKSQRGSMLHIVDETAAPLFHPLAEYEDLSLLEILDKAESFHFDDDSIDQGAGDHIDPLMPNHVFAGPPEAPVVLPPAHPLNETAASLFEIVGGPSSFDEEASTIEVDRAFDVVSPSPPQEQLVSHKRRHDAVFEVENDEEIEGTNIKGKLEYNTDVARITSSDFKSDSLPQRPRFRSYQTGQWMEKYEELVAFHQVAGHCLVPHCYNDNLPLACWVKRQRFQYKLMIEGKASTMTVERVRLLELIGFVWDSQGAAWYERLEELRQFKATHKHCNVPSNYVVNPQLATWVKCQRRQYKLFNEGQPSNMTSERIGELEKLSFQWELRCHKTARTA